MQSREAEQRVSRFSEQAMIELRDIRSQVLSPSGHRVENVNLTASRGETVAVLSDQPEALSDLFEIVALRDHRWSGEYFLDGHAVHMLPFAERRELRNGRIGCVCPSSVVDDLSVAENIEIALSYRGIPRAGRKRHIEKILDTFGITELATSDPTRLTAGQRILTAAARVAAAPPEVVLATDPTAALNDEDSATFFEMLRGLAARGATILLTTTSTHTARFADQVVRIEKGRTSHPHRARSAATPLSVAI